MLDLKDDDKQLMGHLMTKVPEIVKQEGLKDGYRVVVDSGNVTGEKQTELAIHIIGGQQLSWPPLVK